MHLGSKQDTIKLGVYLDIKVPSRDRFCAVAGKHEVAHCQQPQIYILRRPSARENPNVFLVELAFDVQFEPVCRSDGRFLLPAYFLDRSDA